MRRFGRFGRSDDSDDEDELGREFEFPPPTEYVDPFQQRSSSPVLVTSRRTRPSMEQPRQAPARRPAARPSPPAGWRRSSPREEETPFGNYEPISLRSVGAMSLSDEPPSGLSARRRPRAQDAEAAARVPNPTQRLLVVAIDFGTTYSGFAFSYKSDFEADPLSVQCLNIQSGKEQKSQAAKVPTAILFTPNKELDSFGYEAQEKYAKMDHKDAVKWYMFDCFKMELHSSRTLSRDRVLLDKTKKKSMKALDVFSGAIRHLKEHALRELVQSQGRGGLVVEEVVTWVLTVPAIWDDSAKQFMREAATQAGLDNSRLELALEPEAASIYCLNYFKAHQTPPGTASLSRKGARFLTVDCGGGTVDLCVFEVEDGARLKQLHKPEGAACGGTLVDKAFKDLLMQIVGFEGLTAVDNFENLTLMREFEKAKLAIGVERKIAIKIPASMKEQLMITLQNSPVKDEVTLVNNNLMVNGKTAEAFFKKSIDGIVEAMKKVLRSPEVVRVDAILLVGGFSESRVIQDAVKVAFPRDQVLVPPSPSLTVVMGAVQFGHRSGVIATRIAAFTYGIEEYVDPFQQRSSSPVLVTSRRTRPSMEQPRQAPARRPAARPSPRVGRGRSSREEETPFPMFEPPSLQSMEAMSLSDEPPSGLFTRRSRRAQDAQAAARVPNPTQRLLVVAIDFGTTYSGFAFSYKSDFEADPLSVQCLNIQSGKEEQKSQAAKVPTAILFKPNKELDSFGYEAQEKYAKMDHKDAVKWYMFDCFKMELHSSRTLSRDRVLLDKTKKKSMKALDVFSGAIRHLKEHALRELVQSQGRGGLVVEEEVTWVLTVPAIWDDSAKQFMREAATQAGLDNSRLELALEPEAASIYCLNYFKAHQTPPGTASLSRKGARFLTVDCGGGTVDLSVFEVEDGTRLKQLHKPEGAACGGTQVDKAFKDLLMQILGFDGLTAVDNFENLTLMREFEKAKLAIGVARKIAIKIPASMKEQLTITLQNSPVKDEVTLVNNNLMVNGKTAEAFFKKSIDGIVEAMKKVLRSPGVVRVDAILLVGGFSESRVIQDAVKAAFPRDQVLVPPSPSLTVVMGAVQFGHRSEVIATRIAAFTYGIEVEENFVEDYHDPSKRKVIGGQDCCTQVFDSVIKINDVVAVDQELPYLTISPAESGQKIMHLKIYRSPQPQPRYITDEDCSRIGSVAVKMPDLRGERQRQVQLTMSVSGTELKVMARDQNTRKEFSTTCDLLS